MIDLTPVALYNLRKCAPKSTFRSGYIKNFFALFPTSMETSNLAKRGPNGTMTLVNGDPKIESHLLTRCSEGCNWLPGRKACPTSGSSPPPNAIARGSFYLAFLFPRLFTNRHYFSIDANKWIHQKRAVRFHGFVEGGLFRSQHLENIPKPSFVSTNFVQ